MGIVCLRNRWFSSYTYYEYFLFFAVALLVWSCYCCCVCTKTMSSVFFWSRKVTIGIGRAVSACPCLTDCTGYSNNCQLAAAARSWHGNGDVCAIGYCFHGHTNPLLFCIICFFFHYGYHKNFADYFHIQSHCVPSQLQLIEFHSIPRIRKCNID